MAIVATLLTELSIQGVVLAQAPGIPQEATDTVPPEAASVLFSGPQFFVALISGILLAFAFQILLTNFSVAAGISYLGRSSRSSDQNDQYDSDDEGLSIRKIEFGVGIWTLITVTLALFIACLLAVQLSLLTSAGLGAIVGLVIWAAYFSLLVWVSSSTVGSLIGSVVNAATSGFQSILGTATAAIGSRVAKRQVVSTAEAVAAAVRNELGAGIDPSSIRDSIQDYIQRLRLPELNFTQIQRDLEALLNEPEIQDLEAQDRLRHIDRQTLIDLISQRTDFSRDEVTRLADLLEGIWRQTLGRRRQTDQVAELVDYLKSTQSGQLRIDELNAKLDRLLTEQRKTPTEGSTAKSPNALQQTLQMGMNTLIGLVAGRTDISDLDVERIVNQLKSAPNRVAEQADRVTTQLQRKDQEKEAYSPIRIDVERYLTDTYSWQMTPERVAKDFRNLLYDPNANPEAVANQLAALDRSYFVEALSSRGVFTQNRIQQLADTLENIRREAIEAAHLAREREISLDLRQRVGAYLTLASREQLYQLDNGVLPEFKTVLADEEADYATLQLRLASYDREAFRQILWQRQDITPEEAEVILDALEATRNRVLEEAQSTSQQLNEQMINLRQAIETYLRYSDKTELTPDGIKQNLTRILSDSQINLSSLRYRTSQWNRETLLTILSQRGDISEAEASQIVDQVESRWNRSLASPGILAGVAKNQYDQTLNSIADYLRRTNLEELNPEGIQQDLTMLLDNPREGTLALRRRLSHIDRETLVRLLSQRQDLSEAQINRTIDQVEEAIRRIVKAPRRLALRAQQQVMDFESTLEDYLRNTDKEELNPEGIKRDLRLLVESPQLGWQSLSDRLARMDRSTLIALLSQRSDITPEDAERIVTQIESVRDQLLDQIQKVQYRVQEVIDRILNRIRGYLNALNRPELNYDHIRQDISRLLDDPQAGFEALRDRLRHFDRGTLVALISSTRKDISEADANRLIDQIEGARNSVLQRAERIQIETQKRLEEVKLQAQRQMEETRKAAATAAWWLFATALVSAIASAGAGALAAF